MGRSTTKNKKSMKFLKELKNRQKEMDEWREKEKDWGAHDEIRKD